MWLFSIVCVTLSGICLLIVTCGTRDYRKTVKISQTGKKFIWLIPKEVEEISVIDIMLLFIHSLLLDAEILLGICFLFLSDKSVFKKISSGIGLGTEVFLILTIVYLLLVTIQVIVTKNRKPVEDGNGTENKQIRYHENQLIKSLIISKNEYMEDKGIVMLIPFGWGVDTSGYILNGEGRTITVMVYGSRKKLSIGDYDTLSKKLTDGKVKCCEWEEIERVDKIGAYVYLWKNSQEFFAKFNKFTCGVSYIKN